MATPAFLRYLPARLKPLGAPAVWAPLTIFTLISAFMWEYHHNPEWFNRPQADLSNPESSLTPEEQAELAEIDTLDVLLRQSQLPTTGLGSGLNPALGADETDKAKKPDGSAAEGTAPSGDMGGDMASRDNPFAAYEDQYKFPGSASATKAPTLSASPLSGAAPSPSSSFNVGGSAPAGNSPTGNALSEALTRQQGNQSAPKPAGQAAAPAGASAGAAVGAQPTAGFAGAVPSLPTANSGISAPYIRTTPDMSPPVGTTGYQPPASANLPVFNAAPPQPSQSPYSVSPTQQNFNSRQQAAPLPQIAPTTGSYTPPSFTQPEQTRPVQQPLF